MPAFRPLRDRFEEKVIPEPNSGCWLWIGSIGKNGYGLINVSGKPKTASRIAWTLFKGYEPGSAFVLHRCDNPACVNPGHLFLGTHRENMRDRDNKNRQAKIKGSKQGRAKITEEMAVAILLDDRTHDVIAAEYGISPGPVSAIKRGMRWTHVTNGEKDDRGQLCGEKIGNHKLTEPEVRQILKDNRPQWVIAQDFGVCQMTISLVKQRKIWRHVQL